MLSLLNETVDMQTVVVPQGGLWLCGILGY